MFKKKEKKNQSHLVTFAQLLLLQNNTCYGDASLGGCWEPNTIKSSSWDSRIILQRIECLSKELIQLLKILHRNLVCARSGNKRKDDNLTHGSLICSHMLLTTPHKKAFNLYLLMHFCRLKVPYPVIHLLPPYRLKQISHYHPSSFPYSLFPSSWLLHAFSGWKDKVVD